MEASLGNVLRLDSQGHAVADRRAFDFSQIFPEKLCSLGEAKL